MHPIGLLRIGLIVGTFSAAGEFVTIDRLKPSGN
jgi:hypothetical protein